jgi:hypothetical protein
MCSKAARDHIIYGTGKKRNMIDVLVPMLDSTF